MAIDYAIQVKDLYKHYGATKAVNGLSFNVEKGEVFGMLGPNGAGKTTTVEIMVGLRNRDKGEVKVLGLDPKGQSKELKSRIGVQLQTANIYPRLKVKEVVKLFGSIFPRSLPEMEVIDRVGLREKANDQIRKLSGGQVQRLAIAIAMVGDGEIIFLDEPTTGLDPQARRNLWDVILKLKQDGKTVFITTHYMDEAERLCDRVAIVDHGQIISLGSPRSLIESNFRQQALEFVKPETMNGFPLESLIGVDRVQIEGEVVTLYSVEMPKTIAALMEKTAEMGIEIKDMIVRRASLEDVFIKLTGRRIRE